MRVLLISANTEDMNMVPLPLGLNCVAVATGNAGHQVELLDLMGSVDPGPCLAEAIERLRPEVIGISIRNVDNQNMRNTSFLLDPARAVVALCHTLAKVPVVVGGAGFSIFPRSALHYLEADIGVCGEGEVGFPRVLQALDEHSPLESIPGVSLPAGSMSQRFAERSPLDSLPFPDPALWRIPEARRQDTWIPFQTRRGCPMQCIYCSTPALEGTRLRKHSVEEVVRSLAQHVAAGFKRFYFVDNTFNLPPAYAKGLSEAIIAAGLDIHWRCILYPGGLDRELVRLMAASGCVEASLGFESGSEAMLLNLKKGFSREQVRTAAAMLAEFGIRRMGFLLLGGPGENQATVQESLCFAENLELDMLKLTVGIRIYPGTELARIARDENVVGADDDLLEPRFYLARGMEEWLPETIDEWMSDKPYCHT